MPTTPTGMYWESRGSEDAPPVLLIEGFTGQLIGWREAFCDLLAAADLRVLRMDNRDIGRSRHEPVPSAYTIADMANDVVDVVTDAGLSQVTLVGQSMGGMIAQHTALDHPDIVAGAVLFYTTPTLADITPDVLAAEPAQPTTREEAIAAFLEGDSGTTSPAYGYDNAWKRELAGRMWDRDPSWAGIRNQREAIRRLKDLQPRLSELTIPVSLIHGRDDALISPRGSLRIAEHVPRSELHLYPGMGHEIAPALWPDYVNIIARTTQKANEH
jgi:pimeloyl-ACP methyl ester carboxylesterase